jgi:hypothetical protein
MTPTHEREDETARFGLNWLREDMNSLRVAFDDMRADVARTCGVVEGYGKSLDDHVATCPARNKKISSTTITPPRAGGIDWIMAARMWAPLILAIMFGLIALGAYFGESATLEAKVKKIEAATKALESR